VVLVLLVLVLLLLLHVQVQVHAADKPLSLLMLLQLCTEGPCCLMLCNAEGAVRLVAWHHGGPPAAGRVLTPHAHLQHASQQHSETYRSGNALPAKIHQLKPTTV
jgi:hypothetical protein